MTTRTGKGSEVQDILRLSNREAAGILERLEPATPAVPTRRDRRSTPRVPYREVSRVVVMLENEQVGKRTYAEILRNISRGGVAMLLSLLAVASIDEPPPTPDEELGRAFIP